MCVDRHGLDRTTPARNNGSDDDDSRGDGRREKDMIPIPVSSSSNDPSRAHLPHQTLTSQAPISALNPKPQFTPTPSPYPAKPNPASNLPHPLPPSVSPTGGHIADRRPQTTAAPPHLQPAGSEEILLVTTGIPAGTSSCHPEEPPVTQEGEKGRYSPVHAR